MAADIAGYSSKCEASHLKSEPLIPDLDLTTHFYWINTDNVITLRNESVQSTALRKVLLAEVPKWIV